MTITFKTIKDAIKRHLSIIGKRMYSKDGKNLFSDITVSSAEDPIFNQYISAGAQSVEALLRPLVKEYTVNDNTSIGMTLTNTREDEDFDKRCVEFITTYIVMYSVGEYLAMTHPELAEKYRLDAANAIQALQIYAFYKTPPKQAGYSYNNVIGLI